MASTTDCVFKLRELTVHRTIFAFAVIISLTINTSARSQTPGAPPATPSISNTGAASGEAAKETKLEALFQELTKLVPGGVAAGSETENRLKAVIDQFANRKHLEAQQALKDLSLIHI